MSIFASLGKLLILALDIYQWLILARMLLSWVNPDPYHPIMQFLGRATEPVLRPARRLLPSMGGLDFSPMLVLFALWMLQKVIATLASPFLPGMSALLVILVEIVAVIHLLLTLLLVLMLARGGITIHSWIAFRQRRRLVIDLYNPFIKFVFKTTEPLLRPMRRSVAPVGGMDITPLIGALAILLVLAILQEIIATLSVPGFRL